MRSQQTFVSATPATAASFALLLRFPWKSWLQIGVALLHAPLARVQLTLGSHGIVVFGATG